MQIVADYIERGSTGDDRMDLANVIGSDLGLSLPAALEAAHRILTSKWYGEVLAHAWDEGWSADWGVNPYRSASTDKETP